ncbi:MAG: amidohydrolase family protein [Deltaproteobacteria bacterium]|nr:amidohydrolase family protein [Deltaproteobacteria bacterium]
MKAIDTHIHPGTKEDIIDCGGKYIQHALQYFNQKIEPLTDEALAERYQSLDLFGVLLAWDAETATGNPRLSNDYIAKLVKKYPKSGVKFHQSAQGFYPNDNRFYPLWEKITELKVPVLFHMGTTGYGAGVPGGDGVRLKYCRPVPYIDDLAADFPELTIIGAHPAWPWQEEMLAVAMHKANVYIDLSGWSPKYFPPSLVQFANTFLQDKCLFGSDHPYITPDRWLADFEKLPLKPEVKEKILWKNAQKLLEIPFSRL